MSLLFSVIARADLTLAFTEYLKMLRVPHIRPEIIDREDTRALKAGPVIYGDQVHNPLVVKYGKSSQGVSQECFSYMVVAKREAVEDNCETYSCQWC